MYVLDPGALAPMILHMRQGKKPLCPFMHIKSEITGMSPRTTMR